MAIHGRGYRPLTYAPTGMLARLLPLAQIEWRALFKTRWGFFAFLLCAGPSFASLFVLFVRFGLWQVGPPAFRAELGDIRWNPFSLRFYLLPVVSESYLPFLLLTLLVSSRAVAKDRAAGALELLWTRSVTPWGYFFAKWAGSAALLGVLFLALPLVLWGLGVMMAEGWTLLSATAPFMPRFFLAAFMHVLVLSFIATAFSAIAATPAFSSMLWLGLILGTLAVAGLLARLVRGVHWFLALNPWFACGRVAEWIAGVSPSLGQDYPVKYAFGTLGILLTCLLVVLLKRLRTEDAISA